MPGPLQASFRKRLRNQLRKAHGGAYQSIADEPPVRPTTPRLGADPYAKPKPKPKPPVKKHDTPKSPHKEHDPRYRQGAGQAVHAGKIHHELAAIFNGKNEGAGLMRKPPRQGYNISVAGDRRSIRKLFSALDDVDGVWQGQREKSYMANDPRNANPVSVLRRAGAAAKQNDEDAVFIRWDGDKKLGLDWEQSTQYNILTPSGVIDMVDPPKDKLRAAINMSKRYGAELVTQKSVWTRMLLKGRDY